MKGSYRILITTLIFFFVVQNVDTQKLVSSDEWWVNTDSSPLILGMPKNSTYRMLNNKGFAKVTRFEVGCIKRTADSFIRISILKSVSVSLEPNTGYLTGLATYLELKDECEKQATKLGVVKIRFADGAVWQLENEQAQ